MQASTYGRIARALASLVMMASPVVCLRAAPPAFNDANWANLIGASRLDNSVYALAYDGSGNTYVGGGFLTIDGTTVNYIAKWTGSNWSTLGDGFDNAVTALVFDNTGNLYAAGYFNASGSTITANCVAMWNGTNWSSLGAGIGGLGDGLGPYVNALAFDSLGNLYAGGDFSTAGVATANYIAKWNGTNWSAPDSGMNGIVNALVCDRSGNVYAGGSFQNAGEAAAANVAKWNGSAWSSLGSGMSGNGGGGAGGYRLSVYALTLDTNGVLYAGGWFGAAGGAAATNIARWDGGAWSPLGLGISGPVPGATGIENNSGPYVTALACDSSGNLYAGGLFAQAGVSGANNIAKWNGTNWHALGSGVNNEVFSLSLDGSGDLLVGGQFAIAGTYSSTNIAEAYMAQFDSLPPQLPVIARQSVNELDTLTVTNTAVPGIPATPVSYTLESAPSGAAMDTNGIFTWMPGQDQGPSTNVITTMVTETGPPYLTASNSFIVVVVSPFKFTNHNGAITIIGYTGAGGALTIPGTINGLPVVGLGNYAFDGCSNLITVTIPSGLTNIGLAPFKDCAALTAINVDPANPAFAGVAGALFNKSQTKLLEYPAGLGDSFTIPGTVTNIAAYAFADCGSLTMLFFAGNAPAVDSTVFTNDAALVIYYLPGTTGWASTLGGRPTVIWNPRIQVDDANFGVRMSQFGFDIAGATNIPIEVEAITNLANPGWQVLQACLLTNGFLYFSDPEWMNYQDRFYRIRAP